MSIRKPGSIAAVAPLEACDRTLQHGRRLSLAVAGDEDLIEIRQRVSVLIDQDLIADARDGLVHGLRRIDGFQCSLLEL